MAPTIPVRSWDAFRAGLRWRLGEHVSLIGSTGGGKTTLAMELLAFRRNAVVWSSKARDDTIDPYIAPHRWGRAQPTPARPYVEIDTWPPPNGTPKVVLRPRPRSLDEAGQVRYADFHQCASDIMHPRHGGYWCIFADDTYYLCDVLRPHLATDLTEIWTMGRSHDVSLVAAIQKPSHVPLLAYNQPTHLFFWQENDENNLKRLGEIGGRTNVKLLKHIVTNLEDFQVLYLHRGTGDLVITRVER